MGFCQFHIRTRPGSSHPVISFQIDCKDQDEVDHYWTKLSEGGEEGPCGWLKDKFGLSWQVVPRALPELARRPGPGEGAAGDAGDDGDDEDRRRRPAARVRRSWLTLPAS